MVVGASASASSGGGAAGSSSSSSSSSTAQDNGPVSDVIFVVEATALCGAYLNELKANYIIPSLEFFKGGRLEEEKSDPANSTLFAMVTFQASDCLPLLPVDCYGPFTSAQKFLSLLDQIEFIGGQGEPLAHIAEGLATALQCFDDLQQKRENGATHKHCILVCNSSPYCLPVNECVTYGGLMVEQLVSLMLEKSINFSILSPRKIPALLKLFDKAGGDLNALQAKNYAKDPRHLVLLRGYSLQERPLSPSLAPQSAPSSSAPPPHHNPASVPPAAVPSPAAPNLGSPAPIPPPTPQNPSGAPPMHPQQQHPQASPHPHLRPTPPPPPPPLPPQLHPLPPPPPQQHMSRPSTNPIYSTPSPGPPPPPGFVMRMGNPQPGTPVGPGQRPQTQQEAVRWHSGAVQMRPFMTQGQNPVHNNPLIAAQLSQPPPQQQVVPGGAVGPGCQVGVPGMPQGFQQMDVPNPNVMATSTMVQSHQVSPALTQQANIRMQQQQMGGPATSAASMLPGAGGPVGQPPPTSLPPGQGQAPQQPPQSQQNPGAHPQQPGQQSGSQAALAAATQERNRQVIWQGILEWHEKPKLGGDMQKITRQVPCGVSACVNGGEPDVHADNWPQKLIMQLIPKTLVGTIGSIYFKNAKSVLFNLQNCDALESLTKVMDSGFAGCVHFTNAQCDIKVLILLYSKDKRAYLGFIPNDQVGFVDRIRKVIQQQKSQHVMRQGQMPGNPGMPGMSQPNPIMSNSAGNSAASSSAPNILVSQTNAVSMGGGQMSQNVGGPSAAMPSSISSTMVANTPVTAAQLMGQQQGQADGPLVPPQVLPPNLLATMAGGQGQQGQQGGQGQGQTPPGAVPPRPAQGQAPGQPPGQKNDLMVMRQQNLLQIQQLKQTLEQAQAKELQFKSQLENNASMFQQQQQDHHHQQLRAQIQQQLQQRPTGPQGMQVQPQQQQQRLIRPGIQANPGLRHLLQQQQQQHLQQAQQQQFRPQQLLQLQQFQAQQQQMQQQQQQQQQQGGPGGQQQGGQQFDDVGILDLLK